MNLIYLVVSVILSAIVYITTQLDWQYAFYLEYVFLFLASWYLALVFISQEEYERSKKFEIFTPVHLLHWIAIGVALFFLWKYDIKKFRSNDFAFAKIVVIGHAIQTVFLNIYFKIRDIYHHM